MNQLLARSARKTNDSNLNTCETVSPIRRPSLKPEPDSKLAELDKKFTYSDDQKDPNIKVKDETRPETANTNFSEKPL